MWAVCSRQARALAASDSAHWQLNGTGGAVVNHGQITAGAGGAILAAVKVQNTGDITAKGGDVALGAGSSFTVDFAGSMVGFEVRQAASGASISHHWQNRIARRHHHAFGTRSASGADERCIGRGRCEGDKAGAARRGCLSVRRRRRHCGSIGFCVGEREGSNDRGICCCEGRSGAGSAGAFGWRVIFKAAAEFKRRSGLWLSGARFSTRVREVVCQKVV